MKMFIVPGLNCCLHAEDNSARNEMLISANFCHASAMMQTTVQGVTVSAFLND